jgi:hypothetical protein
VADPEVRRRAWQERLGHPAWTARPNAAHAARRQSFHYLSADDVTVAEEVPRLAAGAEVGPSGWFRA